MNPAQYSFFEMEPGENAGPATDREGRILFGARLLQHAPYVPIAFLGLAFYRAWIELVFVGSFLDYPFAHYAGHDLFDIVMIAVSFICAALSRKMGGVLSPPPALFRCHALVSRRYGFRIYLSLATAIRT